MITWAANSCGSGVRRSRIINNVVSAETFPSFLAKLHLFKHYSLWYNELKAFICRGSSSPEDGSEAPLYAGAKEYFYENYSFCKRFGDK